MGGGIFINGLIISCSSPAGSDLSAWKSSLTPAELRNQIALSESQVRSGNFYLDCTCYNAASFDLLPMISWTQLSDKETRLRGLKSGNVLVIPKEERAKVLKEYAMYLEAWKRRKSIFRSIWWVIAAMQSVMFQMLLLSRPTNFLIPVALDPSLHGSTYLQFSPLPTLQGHPE